MSLPEFKYTKRKTITGPAEAQTDYVFPIRVNYGSGTDATATIDGIAGLDVFLNEHAKRNFSDVRFTNAAGTKLDYESRRGGWTATALGKYIWQSVYSPDGILYATVVDGANGVKVYSSDDDGDSDWTELFNVPNTDANSWPLSLFMDSDENLYISPVKNSGVQSIYRCTKANYTKETPVDEDWIDVYDFADSYNDTYTGIWAFCEDHLGNLFAGVYTGGDATYESNAAVLKSPNSSGSPDGTNGTWSIVCDNTDCTGNMRHCHVVVVDPYVTGATSTLYAAFGEVGGGTNPAPRSSFLRSTDSGATWTELLYHATSNVYAWVGLSFTDDAVFMGSDWTPCYLWKCLKADDMTVIGNYSVSANTTGYLLCSEACQYDGTMYYALQLTASPWGPTTIIFSDNGGKTWEITYLMANVSASGGPQFMSPVDPATGKIFTSWEGKATGYKLTPPTSCVFWVQMDSIGASATEYIDICYGKADAVSESDPAGVWLAWDDFRTDSLTTTNAWVDSGTGTGAWGISTSSTTSDRGYVFNCARQNATAGVSQICLPSVIGRNDIDIWAKMQCHVDQSVFVIAYRQDDGTKIYSHADTDAYILASVGVIDIDRLLRYDGAVVDEPYMDEIDTADYNDLHDWKIRVFNDDHAILRDNIAHLDATDATYDIDGYVGFYAGGDTPDVTTLVSFLRIRPYITPEPTYSAAGGEKTSRCGSGFVNFQVPGIV